MGLLLAFEKPPKRLLNGLFQAGLEAHSTEADSLFVIQEVQTNMSLWKPDLATTLSVKYMACDGYLGTTHLWAYPKAQTHQSHYILSAVLNLAQ